MIKLTDPSGAYFWINMNSVESILKEQDEYGYTLITTLTGNKYLSVQTPEQILRMDNE